MLARQTLLDCHSAALEVNLDRDTLLRGVNALFVRTIPRASNKTGQLLTDLEELNQTGFLSDGTLPLRTWLETAIVLSQPRAQAQVFRRAFHALDLGIPPPLPSTSQVEPEYDTSPETLQADRADLAPAVEELERLLRDRERCLNDEKAKEHIVDRIDQLVAAIIGSARVRPGDKVAGTELVKPIGSGSFGTIWLSKRIDTGAFAATKVFHIEKLAEGRMLWHFRRSTVAMTRLRDDKHRSEHIVKIHEIDPSTLAFSMDFLSEGNLEDVASRGWTLPKKLQMITTICGAVRAAHRIGVIHRDIKPANVVLDRTHSPILTDFDIADIKFLTRLSATPGGLGTPVFAAPEQLENADQADERSDIYSLGRLLYFLLLERPPGLRIEKDPKLDNIANYPPALVSIVRRATAFSPERRFKTVGELEDAIRTYQTRGAVVRALFSKAGRWVQGNIAILLVLVTVIVAAVVVVTIQRDRAQEARDRAITAEALQARLSDALDAVNKANLEFKELGAQKDNNTAEISRVLGESEALRSQLHRATVASERVKLELELAQREKQLKDLKAKQREIDQHIEEVRRRLDLASRVRTAPRAAAKSEHTAAPVRTVDLDSSPTDVPVPINIGAAAASTIVEAPPEPTSHPPVFRKPAKLEPAETCRPRGNACSGDQPCCGSIPCNRGICGGSTCDSAGAPCGTERFCCSHRCENGRCTL